MEAVEIKSILAQVRARLGIHLSPAKAALVPIGVSGRHVHLSEAHLGKLFGAEHRLVKVRELLQPGEFAAEETVTLIAPQGVLERVRVLGPTRRKTQVELTYTDSKTLSLELPLHGEGVGGLTLCGPKGSVHLESGVMLSKRHLHCTPALATKMGFCDGDDILAFCGDRRQVLFDNVWVRVSQNYADELHLDTDEANSALVATGDKALVFSSPGGQMGTVDMGLGRSTHTAERYEGVLTEEDVVAIAKKGLSRIVVGRRTIITPLAWDIARSLKIRIEGKELV